MEKIYNVSNMSVMVAKWSRNYKLLLFTLFALSGLFGVNESAWGQWYSTLTATASPAEGGGVYATKEKKTSLADSDYKSPSDESGKIYCATVWSNATFYAYYHVNTGYKFVNWSTGATTWEIAVTANRDNKHPSVTANFAPIDYTIRFKGNGSNGGSTANLEMKYATAQNLTKNGFTREYTVTYDENGGSTVTDATAAYSFIGWATSANGNKVYDDKQSVNNLTTTDGAYVDLYAKWTSASVTLPSATKEGAVLDGWYNGNTKVGEAGASYTPTANVTLKAKWIDKYTPSMTGANQSMMVDGVQETAFSFGHVSGPVAHISVTSISSVNNGNGKVIEYDAVNNKIIAHNAGVATIYFTQDETETIKKGTSETYTYTVYKYNSTFASVEDKGVKVDADVTSSYSLTYTKPNSAYIGTASIAAGTPVLGESTSFYYTLTQNVTTEKTTGSTNASLAITYNAGTKTATGKNAGTGTIHLYQPETYKYNAADEDFVVTVTKNANTLYANNSTTYKPTMRMGKDLAVTLTATNTDYTNSPIQLVKQTVGDATVAVFDYTQGTHSGTVHSKYKKDVTATWSIHQDENYKYLEANGSFSVDVKTASENTCYVLENQSNQEDGWHGNTYHEHTWEAENVAGVVKFDIYRTWGAEMGYNVQQLLNGSWQNITDYKDDFDGDWQTKTQALDPAAKGVRFRLKGGSLVHVKNVSVTRKTYINASNLTIDKTSTNNPVYPSDGVGVGTLPISYSLANGGNLKIANDNPKFTISPSVINVSDCNGGSANISIQYQSTTAGTDVAHLVIYNDVYRKEVTITGITSKRTQVVNWEVGDVVRLGSETENAAWVISGNTVRYSSNAKDIIDVVDGKLVAKSVGSAVITATADGNGDYEDAYDTKTIEVTNDEIQWIEWNQTFLRLKVGGSNVTLEASAQSDVEDCTTNGARPITYSSAKESVVRIDNNTKQLVIVGAGTTVITATQAGGTDKDGHKYMAVSQEKTVIVRDPKAPCENYLYIQPTENEWYCGWNHLNRQYKEFVIENLVEPSDISLQYKGEYKRVALTDYFYGKIHVEEWYDNAWHDISGDLNPQIGNYQSFSHALNRNTTKVRISTHDGVGYHYFKDCKIGQLRYIETNTLDAYEAKVGQTVNQILSISYDNIVGDITLALGHKESNFSISQNMITGDCGDRATVDITVSYTPQAATGNEGEAETLTITDDETTKEITLHGSATVTERYILWDIPETNDKFTVESVELTAAALTKVGNNPAGEVFYSLGGLSTTGTINEDDAILTFAKDGIAYVSAEGKTSASYNTPAAVTKTFNVSKTPTTVDELPTTGTIYGGTAANDVVLTGGSAKNTVNNGAVTGSFKVTSPATLNAGTHDLTIEFTPENKDMYIGFTTTLKDVTVSQITPEAGQLGVTVDDITCGQRIDEAILTNTGSLAGTWYWVDEEANHATPVAGTYDDLNVYFVPSNTNYATVNSTVSVKVNKLETLNVPVALSFCAGESETFRGTEYTEAGEYNVPATGATRDTVYNVTVTVLQPTAGTDSKTITYGDSESWNGIDLSGYAVGSHEVEYHTTNAVGCDSTVTLTLTVNAPIINEYIGTGDWNEDENWSSGSKPDPKEENPDIIVTGTLVVKDTISVGSLTIKPTGGVVIIDKGVLVVNDATPEQNDGYGDLRVADDGSLLLNDELKVRHFTLDAKLGDNDSNPAASGQVSGDEKLNVNGDAYFKMSFDITGQITYGWYDFVVPFEVDAMNGVFDANGVKIVYGTDYIIMSHSEEKRARNQKAWNTFTGTLEPGRIYTITFEETKTWNTFLFKKKAGSDLVNSGTYTSDYSSTIGESQDRGWNGFGNGTLQHRELINLTGISKVQMYNHTYNRYDVVDNAEWTTKALAVGTAFSIQVGSAQSVVLEEANAAKPLRAPRYSDSRTIEEFYLKLTDSDTERTADRLWVSASEEATGEYVIGRDLLKMGTPTQAKAVQIWAINNNMTLCDIEMQLVSEEASCALGLFAPKAGSYELKIERAPEDANLYLTYNGEIIWDLTASPYMFDLSKGTTNGYGLRIEVQAPQMPTGIEESEFSNQSSVRKVLIDNKVYIVTPEGKMYNIIGKGVKF